MQNLKMTLSKNKIIEVVKENFSNFATENPDDNIDEFALCSNDLDVMAEAIADDLLN